MVSGKSVIKNKVGGSGRVIGPERSACGKKFYVVSAVGRAGHVGELAYGLGDPAPCCVAVTSMQHPDAY